MTETQPAPPERTRSSPAMSTVAVGLVLVFLVLLGRGLLERREAP